MSQDSPAIDVELIFRGRFELRAMVRSCDQEHTPISFRSDDKWLSKSATDRASEVRALLSKWMEAAQLGCSHPTPTISLESFEETFLQLSDLNQRFLNTEKLFVSPQPQS